MPDYIPFLPLPARSLSNNSFLETKNATQYPAYSNLDFVVELLTSLHSPNYAYRLEYCLSDRLLVKGRHACDAS